MIQSAEYILDKIEEVWHHWQSDVNSWRSYTAMSKIDEILSDAEKELLKDQGCELDRNGSRRTPDRSQ
ncbi:hypothetical protein CW696_07850 [ANME-2 cluster archaeon]|nr:MAG: hypothetical protein CW696_07850 [ANME-2 cluster archaeon]